MKEKKKVLSLIIAVIMAASIFAVPTASRVYAEPVDTDGPVNTNEDIVETKDISNVNVELSNTTFAYSGEAICPQVLSVADGDTLLAEGTDFSVEYSNNIDPGEGLVIISGINNYSGKKEISFTIDRIPLSKTKHSISGEYFSYTGKARKPYLIIKYDGETLVKNKDYIVKGYKNNVYPGTAKIVVEGKGKFKGTIERAFYIGKAEGLKAASTGMTAVKLSWKKQQNITGYKLYKYNMTTKKWRLYKTIKGASKTSYTVKKLKPGLGSKYKIRTYLTKGGKTYYGPWSSVLSAATKPKQVVIKSFTDNVKLEAVVKWKARNCTGYQIAVSSNSKFKNYKKYKVSSAKTLSKKLVGLSNNKTYYVKVRAYKTYGGKTLYGAWSKTKKTSTDGTGWATFSGKKYYYKNGKPLKGSYTINGNKYYFSKSTGVMLGASATMWDKVKNQSSKTKWLVAVSRDLNRTCVYQRVSGEWVLKYYWKCSTGASGTRTPAGYFTVPTKKSKLNYFGIGKGYTCWHATRITGSIYFHSVLYYTDSKTNILDGRLGMNLSHGCIRMAKDDALWIFKNIKAGTKVVIY